MSHKIKIEQPRLPRSLTEEDFQKVYDQDEPYINACIIRDSSIDGDVLGNIEFSQVVFKNVIFNDVSFENIVLTDVIFEKCDLSNASFMGGNDTHKISSSIAHSYNVFILRDCTK